MSVRWKVTLSALFAVTLGLLIAGWLALRSIERLEIARLQEALTARAGLAAIVLQSPFQPDADASGLQAIAKELSRQALARVTVIRPDGVVAADSDTPDSALGGLENHRGRPEVEAALSRGMGTDIRVSATTGQRLFYLALPIRSGDEVLGVVRLALPMVALEARVHELQQGLAIAFGIALAVAAFLSVLLSRGLTQPLSDMAAVARQLAAGSLDQRIHVTSRDEVGVLGTTLNRMAEQLESTIRAVTEDRAQLLAVLTSMAEGVLVLDCRGWILQANPAFERMFQIQETRSRGRPYSDVIGHPDFNEFVSTVLRSRESRSGEITTAAGRTLRIEATVSGCQRDNEACAILVFHDISTIRRLEKVRKDFVANVSHELRTPLTSIKGYVEALLDGAKDDPEECLRFLDIILKQSDRLNLILEDLLQLSQIESGQVLFKQDVVPLASVVERTVSLIHPLADKKGHRLVIDLPEGLPSVCGDAERLVQVLTNLLDNAVKYTPEGGLIEVRARRLPAAAPGPSDGVELVVADNGIGIPEADRPRVFERFYRVDKARSRELGGTGLGLAIVKHIVENHGGQVWVEGNEPAGSRFVIRLPAASGTGEPLTQTGK
ncbi:two-component system histidine kinase PnpS [Candidatus Nitrospira bockiana]